MKSVLMFLFLFFFLSTQVIATRGTFPLPALPEPDLFGNLLLDRTATRHEMKPVVFSHWLHRQHFTCSVCHEELDFSLEQGETHITEEDNRAGRFCGACHDGKRVFAVAKKENCKRCHNGDLGYSSEKFTRFAREIFPASNYGNRVDWVQALREGLLAPAPALKNDQKQVMFDKRLTLEAEWNFVPPAIFPHDVHLQWMNCNLCHPDLFMIKKKSTEHFSMEEILKGNFCGVCHLTVAFPMDDCERCHPGIDD